MSEVNNNHVVNDSADDLAPPGCVPLTHQVAGHFHGNKRTKLGFNKILFQSQKKQKNKIKFINRTS